MDTKIVKSTVKKRHYCCICSNFSGKIVNGLPISLHRFPADSNLRKIWISRMKTVSAKFSSNLKTDRLCSAHFIGGVYTKENCVPSVFIINNKEKIFKATTIKKEAPTATMTTGSTVGNDNTDDHVVYSNASFKVNKTASELEVSCNFHDYCGEVVSVSKIVNKEVQTVSTSTRTFASVSTQTTVETSTAQTQTETINDSLTKSVGIQVNKPDITFEDIENSKVDVMFYTGIPNAGTFYSLFDEMEEMNTGDGLQGRPRALRCIDEFFLVLMRLRLGLLLQDLAQRFHISKSTCSEIVSRWISYLSVKLSFLTPWPSKDIIRGNLPIKFKTYPHCRVIIDCTEIYTQTPQSLQNRSLMYSHYKSHMTYKSLIGISPNGVITFASDLWAGSISDKQLTKTCGILDLLEPGDQIMADKGFLISDLTSEKGAQLIIPPLKNHKFFRREVEDTRRIANQRIYVEMAIERVKNFRILQGVMPITLSRQASQIWKICVHLTNLQPPLVPRP